MTPGHTTSLLQLADADAAFQILEKIYAETRFPVGGGWSRPMLEREIDLGHGLVARHQQEPCAFVLWRDLGHAWDIILLATDPAYQRQGIMNQLLAEVVRLKPPERLLWLEVHESNLPAQALYKKLGFQQVGQRSRYYRDGAGALLFSLG